MAVADLDPRLTRAVFTSIPKVANEQPGLLPLRASTIYPSPPSGRDIAMWCEAAEGGTYYCKQDSGDRLVRATEWFCHGLAGHLGIAVADYAVVEHKHVTYFGSRDSGSTADELTLAAYLGTPRLNELQQQTEWLGRYLSGLHALDLFLNNGDRHTRNFVLTKEGVAERRLRAIDFAASRLSDISTAHFPVEGDPTMHQARLARRLHGVHVGAALEMVERIADVPIDVVDQLLRGMPSDWMSDEKKRGLREAWNDLGSGVRLPALRRGIRDESLF